MTKLHCLRSWKLSSLHHALLAQCADNAYYKLPGLRRYEKTAFQQEVQRGFDALQDNAWVVLDASKSIEALQTEVCRPCTSRIVQTHPDLFVKLFCECLHPSTCASSALCFCHCAVASQQIDCDGCAQVQDAAAAIISRCKSGAPLRKLWRAASPPLASIGNTHS